MRATGLKERAPSTHTSETIRVKQYQAGVCLALNVDRGKGRGKYIYEEKRKHPHVDLYLRIIPKANNQKQLL